MTLFYTDVPVNGYDLQGGLWFSELVTGNEATMAEALRRAHDIPEVVDVHIQTNPHNTTLEAASEPDNSNEKHEIDEDKLNDKLGRIRDTVVQAMAVQDLEARVAAMESVADIMFEGCEDVRDAV